VREYSFAFVGRSEYLLCEEMKSEERRKKEEGRRKKEGLRHDPL